MLTVSTKGDYGILFMTELAKQYKKGFVSLSDFSKRRRISSNYLHQIVIPLRKKGLIVSKEGVTGGYSLKMAPNKISFLSILEALEGSFAIIRCVRRGKLPKTCPGVDTCEVGSLWKSVQQKMRKLLEQITLQDILHTIPK